MTNYTFIVSSRFMPLSENVTLADKLEKHVKSDFAYFTNIEKCAIITEEYIPTAGKEEKCSQVSTLEQSTKSRNAFVSAIRKFMSMETLTAPLLQELIDHIDVYDVEGKGKDRTQRVVIFYRFVGYIEIPKDAFGRFQANTRQGVAIEYIPKALNASA